MDLNQPIIKKPIVSQTIAVIKYKIQPGTADRFLAVINGGNFKETLRLYTGFASYNLVDLGNDTWCEYILWETMENATDGAKAYQQSTAYSELAPYLVTTSFETAFLETAIAFN